MRCKQITALLEELAPPEYAEAWDNIGLLVGDEEKEIHRIMLAVDATDQVMEAALKEKVDLLVTHHPLIFTGMKSINEKHFIGRRVRTLIRENICYYAMHTNFDIAGGMAEAAADCLHLQEIRVLEPTLNQKGIGAVGQLPSKMTLRELANEVKTVFQLDSVKVFGDLDKKIQLAAISPGSGNREIPFAQKEQAEVLITGDIDHHHGIDAVAQGLMIIDAGHYGLEKIFIPVVEKYLRKHLEVDITIQREEEKNPFTVIV